MIIKPLEQRLLTEPTTAVSRSELTSHTRKNLEDLEVLGFNFEETATCIARRSSAVHWSGRHSSPSFVVAGTDPEGAPVKYWRYEAASPAAGQTFLVTPHGRIRVSEILERLPRPSTRRVRGLTAKRAEKHYLV